MVAPKGNHKNCNMEDRALILIEILKQVALKFISITTLPKASALDRSI